MTLNYFKKQPYYATASSDVGLSVSPQKICARCIEFNSKKALFCYGYKLMCSKRYLVYLILSVIVESMISIYC